MDPLVGCPTHSGIYLTKSKTEHQKKEGHPGLRWVLCLRVDLRCCETIQIEMANALQSAIALTESLTHQPGGVQPNGSSWQSMDPV